MSACAFCVQKLCWQPYLEKEVHVVEHCVYVDMSVVLGINTQVYHADLQKCLCPTVSIICKVDVDTEIGKHQLLVYITPDVLHPFIRACQ